MHVVIVGGSVAGLGAAAALCAGGHRVTIVERDATPMPSSALEAFEKWDRRGSPQTRHSHAFLARLCNLIKEHTPDLWTRLLEAGAQELDFRRLAERAFPDLVNEPGDEEMAMLSCRRITFEWVLRRWVLDSGLVDFRDGDDVIGLLADLMSDPEILERVLAVWGRREEREPVVLGPSRGEMIEHLAAG